MPKLSYGELREKITAFVGDRNDDEALSILEDVADTLTDEPEDWHEKYNALDAEWRERYRKRFNGLTDDAEQEKPQPAEDAEELTLDDVLKAD